MPVMVLDPNLCAGWEPETPVTDSLLRRFLLNWTLGIEAHGLPLGGRSLRRDDLAAVDAGRPTVGANVATLLAPLFPADVDEIQAALDASFENGSPLSRSRRRWGDGHVIAEGL